MSNQLGDAKKKLNVAIVGGGLVGSLEALYLAKRGHRVSLYEYRDDIRNTPLARGRSINLALSIRGRRALKDVGLEDLMINQHGIPMRARMIHRPDGTTYAMPYDPRTNQCIYSVGRNYLNSILLKESENLDNVERYFNHKLVKSNFKDGSLTFMKMDTKESLQVNADLIIGADGAFSTVRKEMMKQPLFNFSQQYIEHGYLELCIPADKDGGFQMPPNYLHIWPRGNFMMIALPNQDCSWTVTLFMPFKNFKEINSEGKLLDFFKKYFQDSIPLIGEKKLIEDFFGGSPSALVAVKCRPYHVCDKALLIGDAAHAVVPFYGQGMNAGFEDCTVLDNLFQKYDDDVASVLEEFSNARWRDAFAVSDLAMYNYIEMRDLVNRPSYRLRKSVDDFLYWLLPDIWVPLYNSVTFSTMPYDQCVRNRQWQNKVLAISILCLGMFLFIILFYYRRSYA
ncbi:kynurenine 3-monooxygenase [Pararge aegeria]|uniref:Kynurenine 3-monooxygenase n=3 Tax=Pararge aegeria TaxID=116150 RepID=A0A8S4SFA0_9NEOP|nr:kynurenine 3-monooxygenase [Pararge aegeria]XP_039747172.1 kynurenine 3-monooxygenase [Pararge aegeria]CAH2264575.1 jg21295 [Pararge aegeria aegeria]